MIPEIGYVLNGKNCWFQLVRRKGWSLWCLFVLAQIHVGIPRSMHCWHCSESYHFVGVRNSNHPQLLENETTSSLPFDLENCHPNSRTKKKPWKYLECQLYTVLLQLKMTCYGGKSTSAIHSKRSHFLSLPLFRFLKVFWLSKRLILLHLCKDCRTKSRN